MKITILGSILFLLILGCAGKENPILGYWIVDNAKTINELTQSNDKTHLKWVACYKQEICGNYLVFYGEEEYYFLYPISDNEFYKTESIRYHLTKNGEYFDIKAFDSGETLLKIKMSGDQYEVELEGFKEFLTRTYIDESKIQWVMKN
jgi:hypothetical protein